MRLGPNNWHGGGNLPACRWPGNRRSLETAPRMRDILLVVNDSFPLSLPRTVALVGLMGAGKTAIGKRLALRLGLPFVDADDEIERAAGCTVSEFFERFGETEFRNGERRVISRLLDGPPHVLSTGGGAYMDADTRALLHQRALTIWLRADLDVLFDRVKRRANRPLLRQGNPRDILERLMIQRYPVYAEADIVVDSSAQPADVTTEQAVTELRRYLGERATGATA
jgi:shikimate kinase